MNHTIRTTGPLSGLLVVLLVVLTGCGAGDTTAAGPGAADPRDCALIRRATAPAGAPVTALVVDDSASGHPAALTGAVTAALVQGRSEGGALDVVAVDGAGAPPRTVLRGVALDPVPDVESADADRARDMVPACVQSWITSADAVPTAPGSDVVAALNEAARAHPRRLLVVGDGIATAGALDLGRIGLDADAGQVADQLAAGLLTDGLRGTPVIWSGLGGTRDGLAEPLRANVERIWTASLTRAGVPADRLLIDRSSAPAAALPDGVPLPADPVRVPATTTVVAGGTRTVSVPEALLFEPGSAALLPAAGSVLGPLAAGVPAGARVTVVGHSADFGDDAYRHDISLRRAEAVVDRLAALGVARGVLHADGVGSGDPAVDEWPGGHHDLAAAAANRRVVVTVSG